MAHTDHESTAIMYEHNGLQQKFYTVTEVEKDIISYILLKGKNLGVT